MSFSIRVRSLALPLALGITMVAGVQAQSLSGEGWNVLATEHFTIQAATDEATARRVGRNLEELRALMVQQLDNKSLDEPTETLVYLFPDADSFAPFALGGGSAFFVPHSHANFAALVAPDAGRATPVVNRQYVNHFIGREMPQVPLWMRTGLAELLSSLYFDTTTAIIGAPVSRDSTLLNASGLGVDEVLAMETLPNNPERRESFARSSWALVHALLVEDPDRIARTRAWMQELQTDESATDGFLASFGSTSQELDVLLRAYAARDDLPQRSIEVAATITDGEFTALSAHDALMVQADLLLHTQPTETELIASLTAAATELEPDSPVVKAVHGLRKQQDGDLTGARDLYEQALGPLAQADWIEHRDGFRLLFYYGDAELELMGQKRPETDDGKRRLEQTIDAFERCTALRPAFGEGWARLGYAYSLTDNSSTEAVPAMEKAYEMLPAREDVAMNLLLAYARVGERPKAVELVDNLEHRGESPQTIARAKEVLYQIDYNAAAQLVRERDIDGAAKILKGIVDGSTNPAMVDAATTLLGRIGR